MGAPRSNRDRPTLSKVAQEVGVSPALASLALNGRPGPSDVKRAVILAAADRLGYRPDPLARELRTGTSSIVGFLVRNIANPFFNDVLAGMQEAAFEQDVTVVTMDSEYSEDRERRHIRTLLERRVGALAIAPVGRGAALQEWQRDQPDRRTVLVNSSMNTADRAPRVEPNPIEAVDLAMEHLVGGGHRRIAFLTAPEGLRSDWDRLDAYRTFCTRTGIPSLILEADLQGADVSRRIRTLLDQPDRPTAVVTNSDHAAHFVYLGVREAGARVGRDLSVVGHDDLPTSALLDPPLTTIAVDRRAIGRETFRRLSGQAEGDLMMPVSLVIRGSTPPVGG